LAYLQLAESDLAAQARVAAGTVAGTVAKTAQSGAKTASEGFHRFVEGPSAGGYSQVPFDETKRAFWDDFSSVAETKKDSSIGTSAMGKGGSSSRPNQPAAKKDEWDDW
jgi:ADP-ribosylation factor GTPase-activating protein 1